MKPLPYVQFHIPFPVGLHRLWDDDIRAYALFFSLTELHYTMRSQVLSRDDIIDHTQFKDSELDDLLQVLSRHKLIVIDGSMVECKIASEGVERATHKKLFGTKKTKAGGMSYEIDEEA